jgi:hypothetical protein
MTDNTSKPFPRRWIVAMICLEIVGMVIFGYLGIFEYFLPIFFSVAAIILAASMSWKLHHESWFWVTVVGAILIHTPLIIWIAHLGVLKGHIDGRGLAALVLVDAVLITTVIRFPDWVEETIRWFSSSNTEFSSSSMESSSKETERTGEQ